jgi:hypothetical protein
MTGYPHAIYYLYFGETLNIALRKGGSWLSKLPEPGREIAVFFFLPHTTASSPGSESGGSPVLCEIMSLLFNETNG